MFTCIFGYKYVKVSIHQEYDDNCEQPPYQEFYQTSGWCLDGNVEMTCSEDGSTITSKAYPTSNGCKGKPNANVQITANTCSEFIKGEYSCVDDFEIPSNTLVYIQTNSSCQDDPNWKNEIRLVGYYYLDYCIQSNKGAFEITCNSSVPYRMLHNSTTECSGESTGYSWFKEKKCSKENPFFQYCNI
ncbi:hypothetical protein ACTFIV_007301 [Dictyostelium citrinum]